MKIRIPSKFRHFIKSDLQFFSRIFFKNAIGLFRNIKFVLFRNKLPEITPKFYEKAFIYINQPVVGENLKKELLDIFENENSKDIVKDIYFKNLVVQKRIISPLNNINTLEPFLNTFYNYIKNTYSFDINYKFISVMKFIGFDKDFMDMNDIYANKFHVDWVKPGTLRTFIPVNLNDHSSFFQIIPFDKWSHTIDLGYKSRIQQGGLESSKHIIDINLSRNIIFDASRILHKQNVSPNTTPILILLMFELNDKFSFKSSISNIGILNREK